ncbi:PQQ-dependent sugar dehydrogenase [Sphingobacterium bovistauri]|uniref:PQQ-dependent sugar dehydrogenase n=1 Tax=Sphingobacterium bovistauri TaxID=2781959 RepID=A0ABS7Z5I8_9SPHI|nr:PQQ-dependent sugar dehydrogenase [Sphingobacterium bovistauri]MCA5005461.1 PQQ-dependent sugar dehydrogenase [Sphingobacterium bovistauri]
MRRSRLYIVIVGLLVSAIACDGAKNQDFIDYIKIGEDSYLGVSKVQEGLEVPWDIQFNESTNSIFVAEIKGGISEIDLNTNAINKVYNVPNVFHRRTAGLLGMALHPDFDQKPFIYVCYTIKEGDSVYAELTKLEYKDKKIISNKPLLKIEGANGHNGSRLIFDSKGYLYWATGDAHSLTHAQDSTTLNGKVLRMTDDGQIPPDNPISNSYVYAWGFRNIQGMTITSKGNLMTSEHGDAIEDEINWVRPLNNYGWIDIEGYHDTEKEKLIVSKSPRTEPIKAWTPVIAPAGLKYYGHSVIPEWNNSLLLVSLKNQSLRVLKLDQSQTKINGEQVFLKDYYGRIRAVTTDSKGNIYIATSNKDWNPQKGFPLVGDDKILKIEKVNFTPQSYLNEYVEDIAQVKDGKTLYNMYCASCHKEDGKGISGTFPPLIKTETVGNKEKLIHTILYGLTGEIEVSGVKYDQAMPSFQFLSDIDIAKITSYVRSSFGNSQSAIGETEVMINRKNTTKN